MRRWFRGKGRPLVGKENQKTRQGSRPSKDHPNEEEKKDWVAFPLEEILVLAVTMSPKRGRSKATKSTDASTEKGR